MTAVAFSPDGHTLAAATSDARDLDGLDGGAVQLWDVTDRHAPARTATVPADQDVTAVAFSPDGHTLAAATGVAVLGGGGGTVQLWDVEWGVALSGHLHDWACSAAGGGLAADEWPSVVPGISYRPSC